MAAGFDQSDHQARAAASAFVLAGGTRDGWLALYDAAVGMSRPGPSQHSDGQQPVAGSRQKVEGGEGQMPRAQPGHIPSASAPSSNRDREGHANSAPAGHLLVALSVREPTDSQRSASLKAAKTVSVTIMDTFKIDGVAIGSWSVALARVEARRKTRDGYILREALKAAGDASDKALLRNVVKLEQMQRIRQASEEFADAN